MIFSSSLFVGENFLEAVMVSRVSLCSFSIFSRSNPVKRRSVMSRMACACNSES